MINKTLLYLSKNKFAALALVLLIVFSLIFIFQSTIPQPAKPSITEPVIPTSYPESQPTIPRALSDQTLTFNWINTTTELPATSKKYSITKPLINQDTITLLSQSLGFSSNDLLKSAKSTSRTWENNNGSLFSSIDQNQIIYRSKKNTTSKSSTVTKDEAITISKSILSDFFGNNFVETLATSARVRFLKFDPKNYSPTPIIDQSRAEYIEVSFRQTIDTYFLSSLAGNTNLLSIVIDNQRNLYRLEIYGGFFELSPQGEQSTISIDTLKSIASQKALKISSLPNVSLESKYLNSTIITINVDSYHFGYFLTSDNGVIPAIFISGTATAKGLSPQPVTYVVPASE